MDINLLESGYLELWIGPMFSGKTSAVIKELTKMADTGWSVCLITHGLDTREKMSHSSQNVGLTKITVLKSENLDLDLSLFDVIGIDEAQFFPDLLKVVDLVDNQKKIVFVAGLDGDYKRKPIGKVLELIPFSDKTTKLSAKCHFCTDKWKSESKGNRFRLIVDSPFTARTVNCEEQILIGAAEKYVSLCRYHYLNR